MEVRITKSLSQNDRRFEIPKYEKADLYESLSLLSGVEKDLTQSQIWSLEAIQKLRNRPVVAEALGWLSLWEKFYEVVRAALGGFTERSSLAMGTASRSANELTMCLHAILEPVSKVVEANKSSLSKSNLPWRQSARRLRAYCGWCISNDLRRYKHLLDRTVLDDLFDPTPAREIARGDSVHAALHAALFGELEELSDAEAENDRRKFQEGILKEKDLLLQLITELDLAEWTARSENTDTFFSLFESSQTTIARRFREIRMWFAYASFIRNSQIIHGSSFNLSVGMFGDIFVPKPSHDESEIESAGREVASLTKSAMLILNMLADHCIPETSKR